MKLVKILLVATMSCSVLMAQAAVKVSTLGVYFPAKGPRFKDFFVKNVSDKKEYVKISAFKRVNPGVDPNEKSYLKGNPKAFGLVVTPAKMVLAPHAVKRVRLLSLVHGNKEDVIYGVDVLPVSSPLKRLSKDKDAIVGGVKMTSSFRVSVYMLPPNPKAKISIKRDGKLLIAHNAGNTNALLESGKQCKQVEGKEQCDYVDAMRVYAHSDRRLELKEALPVTYRVLSVDGKDRSIITSN